jgi:hypothetical protein
MLSGGGGTAFPSRYSPILSGSAAAAGCTIPSPIAENTKANATKNVQNLLRLRVILATPFLKLLSWHIPMQPCPSPHLPSSHIQINPPFIFFEQLGHSCGQPISPASFRQLMNASALFRRAPPSPCKSKKNETFAFRTRRSHIHTSGNHFSRHTAKTICDPPHILQQVSWLPFILLPHLPGLKIKASGITRFRPGYSGGSAPDSHRIPLAGLYCYCCFILFPVNY